MSTVLGGRIALLLLVCAAGEALFRLVFPLPEIKGFNRALYMPVAPAAGGVTAVRSVKLLVHSSPDDVLVAQSLNEYGFRGKRWSIDNHPGTQRIFFVGDSFVEGIRATDAQTIPKAFEAAANKSGVRTEAMNLGIAGTGLHSYVRTIVDGVPLFRPDHILLFLYANDLPDNVLVPRPRTFGRYKLLVPRFVELVRAAGNREQLPYRWPWRTVRLDQPAPSPNNPWSDPAFERENRKYVSPRILAAMKAGNFGPYRAGGSMYLLEALRTPFDLRPMFAALRRYAEIHGAKLSVLYLPERGTVTGYYRQFEQEFTMSLPADVDMTLPPYQLHRKLLRAQCADVGLPFLDLSEYIAGEERGGRHMYLRYDDHLRGSANQAIGKTVFEWWADVEQLGR